MSILIAVTPLLQPASFVTWLMVAFCVALAGTLAYEHWGKR